jgi:hypothetical protein
LSTAPVSHWTTVRFCNGRPGACSVSQGLRVLVLTLFFYLCVQKSTIDLRTRTHIESVSLSQRPLLDSVSPARPCRAVSTGDNQRVNLSNPKVKEFT